MRGCWNFWGVGGIGRGKEFNCKLLILKDSLKFILPLSVYSVIEHYVRTKEEK